jgi:hypothetical protein
MQQKILADMQILIGSELNTKINDELLVSSLFLRIDSPESAVRAIAAPPLLLGMPAEAGERGCEGETARPFPLSDCRWGAWRNEKKPVRTGLA